MSSLSDAISTSKSYLPVTHIINTISLQLSSLLATKLGLELLKKDETVQLHIEDIKNLDFIKQFPLVSNLDEIEDEEEKLIEIGKALNQIDEEGNPIVYQEDTENVNFPEGTIVISDPELIEQQENTPQIDTESEISVAFQTNNNY